MIALTSLIAFAFCAASILVRVTLKTVFSFGAATSSTGAALGAPAAAGAEAGIAMSTMFSVDCDESTGQPWCTSESSGFEAERRSRPRAGGRTLSASTSSAASSRVRVATWSTIAAILGETDEGGGGGLEDAAASVGSARNADVDANGREMADLETTPSVSHIGTGRCEVRGDLPCWSCGADEVLRDGREARLGTSDMGHR